MQFMSIFMSLLMYCLRLFVVIYKHVYNFVVIFMWMNNINFVLTSYELVYASYDHLTSQS